MDQRSPEGMLEEWRKQWLSGQTLCRSSTGAACWGGGNFLGAPVVLFNRLTLLFICIRQACRRFSIGISAYACCLLSGACPAHHCARRIYDPANPAKTANALPGVSWRRPAVRRLANAADQSLVARVVAGGGGSGTRPRSSAAAPDGRQAVRQCLAGQ